MRLQKKCKKKYAYTSFCISLKKLSAGQLFLTLHASAVAMENALLYGGVGRDQVAF